jgi:hypothetical protein
VCKRAAFVLGTYERSAVDAGAALTKATCQLLDDLASTNDLVADVVFADQDAFHASQNKSKIGITHLREERPRLLEEIINARPDFIMCFGPVAAAAIFDHGSMTEEMLWRKAHYPLSFTRSAWKMCGACPAWHSGCTWTLQRLLRAILIQSGASTLPFILMIYQPHIGLLAQFLPAIQQLLDLI